MFNFWQAPDHWQWSVFVHVFILEDHVSWVQQVTFSTFMCLIWRNSVLCFDDFTLLKRKDSAQMTIMGQWGCGVQSRVFPEGTEVRSQLSSEGPFLRKTSLIIPGGLRCLWKRDGGPRHPWGGLGRFGRGNVWFDSAHWVRKLCDNF